LALAVAALCGLPGCALRQEAYSTPGALYIKLYSAENPKHNYVQEIRNGRGIRFLPSDFVVPRDRPDRSFVDADTSRCNHNAGTYRPSPDGTKVLALCYMPGAGSELRVFDRGRPGTQRVLLKSQFEQRSGHDFAWLDNDRFAALEIDHKTCPYATLYLDAPTRVVTFDVAGHRLSTGPCAFGIVAGEHRVALQGEGPNGPFWHVREFLSDDVRYWNDGLDRVHPTWSVDYGKTWHDGTPETFDGNDNLLYEAQFDDGIFSEQGQTVFGSPGPVSVRWSR
jgi:hypothetical protein